MKGRALAEALHFLLDPVVRDQGDRDRSRYERLHRPFTFTPRLSLVEAVVASVGAFLRILLGSILFAVWGAFSLVVWSSARGLLLRAGLLLALLLGFLLAFALLLLVTKLLMLLVLPRRR